MEKSAHSSDKYAAALQKNINQNPFTSEQSVVKEKPFVDINKVAKSASKEIDKAKKRIRKLFK